MMTVINIIFLKFLILNLVSINLITGQKNLFCVHQTLTAYDKGGDQKYSLEDIDSTLCTHMIYAYLTISDDGEIQSKKPTLDFDNGNLEKFNNLKKQNKDLKTIIGIGGWENEPSTKYSEVAAQPTNRENFIKSTVEFLKKYGFDGIALHWCFPGLFGGDPIYDRINFPRWLKEIKEEFNKSNLILMVMVQGTIENSDLSYDVASISENVDFIFLTTYDLYGLWRDQVGIHSGLYKSPNATQKFLSADYIVVDWLDKGATPSKLIMAIPFFGRAFTLADQNKNMPGSKFSGAGINGELISYNEICKLLKFQKWNSIWDPFIMGTYAYKDDQWVGYDNVESIKVKVEYITDKGLGGAAAIFIEDDDFKNICGDGKYPLLSTLSKELNSANVKSEKGKAKHIVKIQVRKKNIKTGSSEIEIDRSAHFEL